MRPLTIARASDIPEGRDAHLAEFSLRHRSGQPVRGFKRRRSTPAAATEDGIYQYGEVGFPLNTSLMRRCVAGVVSAGKLSIGKKLASAIS